MKTKLKTTCFILLAGLCTIQYAATNNAVVWNTDFIKTVKMDGMTLPAGWEISGTKSGVNKSVFNVKKDKEGSNILHMSSNNGRGGLIYHIKDVDLNKYPVMCWKWKAIKLPEDGDGRIDAKGDQAIEIYVLSGSIINQKCIVYTWETETPKDASKSFSVFLGAFKAKWFCVRNKTDKLNHWYIEKRNVADDFKKVYGFIPDKIAVMIYCKSDMTKTGSEAELSWIKFLK